MEGLTKNTVSEIKNVLRVQLEGGCTLGWLENEGFEPFFRNSTSPSCKDTGLA